jgi:hypothetical protein
MRDALIVTLRLSLIQSDPSGLQQPFRWTFTSSPVMSLLLTNSNASTQLEQCQSIDLSMRLFQVANQLMGQHGLAPRPHMAAKRLELTGERLKLSWRSFCEAKARQWIRIA